MESSTEEGIFDHWFKSCLIARGIDISFESYLVAILRDDQREEYFKEALDTLQTSENNTLFCLDVIQRFNDPSLCDVPAVSMQSYLAKKEEEGEYTETSPSQQQYHTEYIDNAEYVNDFNEYSPEEYDNNQLQDESEQETGAWYAEVITGDGVDWAELAYQLESMLLTDSEPGTHYSPEAIFSALSVCSNDVNAAFYCIKNAEEMALASKPCRHHMTGKCMRKDCMFEHDFAHIVCRYWLTSGCVLEVCPFLHEFPYQDVVESQSYEYYDPTYDNNNNNGNEFPQDFDASFPSLPTKASNLAALNPTAVEFKPPAIELGFNFGTQSENKLNKPPITATVPVNGKTSPNTTSIEGNWVTSGSD
jgi:hypothetical protein